MFCEHYGTTPFSVTPNKPRHKVAVEGGVRLVQERCTRPLAGHLDQRSQRGNAASLRLAQRGALHREVASNQAGSL